MVLREAQTTYAHMLQYRDGVPSPHVVLLYVYILEFSQAGTCCRTAQAGFLVRCARLVVPNTGVREPAGFNFLGMKRFITKPVAPVV